MTKAHLIVTAAVMPAGEYWVGDPCYAVADERWMEWLEAANYENEPQILLAELDGKPVLGISTAYGDGTYLDEQGRAYPVDAGLIGITPVELTDGEPSGMHKVTFTHDITCSYDDGTIHIGNITIDTDPGEVEETCWGCGYSEYNCHCEDETEEEDDNIDL